jgi:16S rRNA (cytosine1402-N4)-methyltransferase
MNKSRQIHIPVLLEEVLKYLNPKEGESYLDLTAGYGGHARAVLGRTLPAEAVLVDRDQTAIEQLTTEFAGKTVTILKKDFQAASQHLLDEHQQFDMILADLGVSSLHLDNASRGFTFKDEGPLDMRMDQSQELTAEKIVNSYSEEDLASIIRELGEEPKARKIAHAIVEARPLHTTTELANLITKIWPGHSKVHPATRSFQALRIAVNSELAQLKESLPIWVALLKPGGRLVVISFHSLEDRLVKQLLNDLGGDRYDSELTILTKQPVVASNDELVFNPRSRSAKLRAAVKIKNKKEG